MKTHEVAYPRKWEEIDGFTHRLKVPGGWIVRSEYEFEEDFSTAITFLPDPNWTWKLEPIEAENETT